MQNLTYAQICAAARKAYAACKLTAQHPTPEQRQCVYDGGGDYRCAIGAAFDDATIAAINEQKLNWGYSASTLNGRVVKFPTRELTKINQLQRYHDNWAVHARDFGRMHQRTRDCELVFARALGIRC